MRTKKRRKKEISSIKIFAIVTLVLLVFAYILSWRMENRKEKSLSGRTASGSGNRTEETVNVYKESGKTGRLTKEEKKEKHVRLLQTDPRWGWAAYGGSNMAESGCGPTCLAMAVVSLCHGETTPYDIAKFSEKQGFYVEGQGTSWTLMTEGANHYGLESEEIRLDEGTMKSTLDVGGNLILALGAGDFTTEGHFVLIYGYGEEGFYLNDPNSVERSQKVWDYDTLRSQIRNMWAIYRAEGGGER